MRADMDLEEQAADADGGVWVATLTPATSSSLLLRLPSSSDERVTRQASRNSR